jgi:hypothetical protein
MCGEAKTATTTREKMRPAIAAAFGVLSVALVSETVPLGWAWQTRSELGDHYRRSIGYEPIRERWLPANCTLVQ